MPEYLFYIGVGSAEKSAQLYAIPQCKLQNRKLGKISEFFRKGVAASNFGAILRNSDWFSRSQIIFHLLKGCSHVTKDLDRW
jgi:hypothetical protein